LNRDIAKTLYLFLQSLRREDILGILTRLEETQWYPTERLLNEQWTRLKNLLDYVYEDIPYYRNLFRERGIEPGDIKTRDDLKAIPPLTKADIRRNFENLQANEGGLVEMSRTSGSTGEPLMVVRDRTSYGYHRANMFRLRRWFNSDIGSFEATFRIFSYPFWERQKTRMKDSVLNRIRIDEKDLSDKNMRGFYRRLEKAKPDIFYGFPSLMIRFAKFMINNGIEPNLFTLKAIIATSEMLFPAQKEVLENFFDAPVVNEYGCTETGIVAIECPAGGWHVPVESCLVEVIPADDLDVDEGIGRLIVTDLMNRAMPFIRYDVGDLARIGEGTCSCGRGLPTIEGVVGRVGRIIDLPGGGTIHSFIFFNIFKKAEIVAEKSVREFQVRYTRPNRFEFLIVPDENFNDDVLAYIRKRVDDALGEGCVSEFKMMDEIIPSSNGKFEKFIILDE